MSDHVNNARGCENQYSNNTGVLGMFVQVAGDMPARSRVKFVRLKAAEYNEEIGEVQY